MHKLYIEHPEFDEYTRFDTETGRLFTIGAEEFKAYLPPGFTPDDHGIQRIQTDDADIFLGETPETHTRFPRRVYFQITRNCNLTCPACFIKAERGGAHAPTSAITDMAEFMAQNGLMEVRLTGGEPTTHPDFFPVVKRFQELGVYVSVATNGVLNRRTLDHLCELPNLWVICSVDGNRETHNRYRPGTFDRIMENLQTLKHRNPSTRLRLTTVLTKENQGQMLELGQICQMVNAESITVIPLRPQVRDSKIREEMVTAGEFRRVLDSLVEAKHRFGIQFTSTIETDYKNAMYGDPVFRKRSSCAAGREGVNLDYDAGRGEFLLYGCSYSPASDLTENPLIRRPFLAGTFRADSPSDFLDIWRDESAWTIFRDLSLKSQECLGCNFLKRKTCTGSCPIQNIDYTSLDISCDVLSQLKERMRQTGEWYCYKNLA